MPQYTSGKVANLAKKMGTEFHIIIYACIIDDQ